MWRGWPWGRCRGGRCCRSKGLWGRQRGGRGGGLHGGRRGRAGHAGRVHEQQVEEDVGPDVGGSGQTIVQTVSLHQRAGIRRRLRPGAVGRGLAAVRRATLQPTAGTRGAVSQHCSAVQTRPDQCSIVQYSAVVYTVHKTSLKTLSVSQQGNRGITENGPSLSLPRSLSHTASLLSSPLTLSLASSIPFTLRFFHPFHNRSPGAGFPVERSPLRRRARRAAGSSWGPRPRSRPATRA